MEKEEQNVQNSEVTENKAVELNTEQLKPDKKITISFDSGVIAWVCDAFTLVCVLIVQLLRLMDDAFTARRVFMWMGGIVLLAGLVFYSLKVIKEKKFTFTPTFILQLFTFWMFTIA